MTSVKEGKYKEIIVLIIPFRVDCYAHCVNDNFPSLSCTNLNISLEYNGNYYDQFYYYPKKDSDHYRTCLGYVDDVINNQYSFILC